MTDLVMDYLGLDALLSAEELAWRDTVRAFVRDRIRPNITDWHERAVFPRGSSPGWAGSACSARTCLDTAAPGRSAVEYGLAALELEAAIPGSGPSSACRDRWP